MNVHDGLAAAAGHVPESPAQESVTGFPSGSLATELTTNTAPVLTTDLETERLLSIGALFTGGPPPPPPPPPGGSGNEHCPPEYIFPVGQTTKDTSLEFAIICGTTPSVTIVPLPMTAHSVYSFPELPASLA
jgi:hypothetical protein